MLWKSEKAKANLAKYYDDDYVITTSLISPNGEIYRLSEADRFVNTGFSLDCIYGDFDMIVSKFYEGHYFDVLMSNDDVVPCHFWYDEDRYGFERLNVFINIKEFKTEIKMEFNHNNKLVIELSNSVDKKLSTHILQFYNRMTDDVLDIVEEFGLPEKVAIDVTNLMSCFWWHFEKFDLKYDI